MMGVELFREMLYLYNFITNILFFEIIFFKNILDLHDIMAFI